MREKTDGDGAAKGLPMPGTVAAKDVAPLPGSDQRTILPPAIPAEALVRVTPDDADWTYQPGETAKFNVTVVAGPYPAEGFPIVYRLGQEMLEGEDGTAIVPAGGLELTGTLAVPGFLRCIVTAPLGGKEVRRLATVGFAPERLRPTQTEPADFDNFWEKQKAVRPRCLPSLSSHRCPSATPRRGSLSFQHPECRQLARPEPDLRVLSVPRGPGPFPALLAVPGAGVRPYGGKVGLAENGIITLEIDIHGIPVNLDPAVHDQLSRGAMEDYNRSSLDNRGRFYYRRIYLGCLRIRNGTSRISP